MPQEEETHASLARERSGKARRPGAWQALVIVAVSALAVGYWARPGDNTSSAAPAVNISRVAEVAPQDVTAALGTVEGSPEQVARFREREACSRRLAWVTIRRSPGQPAGRIRLQSGTYFSPAFDLTDAPVRVGLPYPAPYATGHGTISVLGTTADAIVALTPAWHVAAQSGLQAREVTWTPLGDCPAAARD
jgi:hypothetical protein